MYGWVYLAAAPFAVQQMPANPFGLTPQEAAKSVHSDDSYRIGPGDVLDIRVFNRPQLSRDAVRVDSRGMIRMPLLNGEIQAACRTESELAETIRTLYFKYLRNPQVDVFIKEYQSQPVAVIGAVNAPGRFQLTRKIRLFELLAHAGGPADKAGRFVQVVHSPIPTPCQKESTANSADAEAAFGLASYQLADTLRGIESANPFVLPGDIVSVAEAEQVYVVGNVLRPSAIQLKDTVTLSRAIAMAGGLMPDSKADKIRIVRQGGNGGAKKELIVDLRAIEKRQAEDVVLMPNDVVEVQTSAGKRFLRTLAGTIAPAIVQMPVRVVP